MTDFEAGHPSPDRLSDYALGRLIGREMDEIEQHLSACDSCCQLIRIQPEDALVAKLRGRGAATFGEPSANEESAVEPASGFQVPSSFVAGTALNPALPGQPIFAGPAPGSPGLAGLPQALNDHARYRVVAALGAGGMGAVYRAEHRLMDRPVALKVIRGDLLGSAAMVERFRGEVKAAARLASHPNIVAAYDAEQAGETHMLVMEFVEGTDLAELVRRRGPLPVDEACEYARQAALGLQHASLDGMVHRDIKPQNLMRTTRGQVKILDFGLARFASEAASHRGQVKILDFGVARFTGEAATPGGMTAQGMVLGSADYIAPEQIDDPHAADIRADIYSLGCTLYFLLAGRPPFPDGSLNEKLMAHAERTPRPLAEIRADVPLELATVVSRMIAKEPEQRFQTPDEVARALAPFADGRAARTGGTGIDAPASAGPGALPMASPPLTPTVGDPQPAQRATRSRLRRPWVRIAAVLALLTLGGGSLALIFTLKRGVKTVATVQREAPTPDLLAGAPAAESGEIARSTSPNDLPGPAGTIVVLAPAKQRGGLSLVYAWDGKSEHASLLFGRKSIVVQDLHAFAVGRDGRQYYLCSNEPSLVQADKDGEKLIFTHRTLVRDLALDEDDNIYFSEGSGARFDGKIYRLVPATDKAAARAELFCTVDPRKVSGYWDGIFAFGRNAKGKVDTNTLYLSTGNSVPGYIFRITRHQGQWSAPTWVHRAEGKIMGLVITSPATAYYTADNTVCRLTSAGSKVAFTVPGVSGLLDVSVAPEGKMIKPGGNGAAAQ